MISRILSRLYPFVICVIIYFIAWLPKENPSVISTLIKCLPIFGLLYFVKHQKLSFAKEHAYQRRVFLGLVFSCLGDAFLVWDGRSLIYTYAGIVAFGVAHLAYISAFGFSKPYYWFKGVPFFSTCAATLALFYSLLDGVLLAFASAYIMVIYCMGWRAFAKVDIFERNWSWNRLCACIGAILFMMSDFLIGINMFHTPIPMSRLLIMSTYYVSQALIAVSAVNTAELESPSGIERETYKKHI